MSITITDPALLAQFAAAAGVVQLTDQSGGLIGTLHKEPFGAPPPGYVFPVTDGELARRRSETTGRPLGDILPDLKRQHGGGVRRSSILSCVFFSILLGGSAAVAADTKPDEFVHVQKGTTPVIVSAPHGGRRKVPDVPERVGDGVKQFVTVRDDNTAELAEALAAEIEKKLGGKPWVVIAKFERKYIDANRPRDAAYESDKAKPYYDAYHAPLEAACKAVKETHGRGLLLDIHGQAPLPDTICRGTQNGKSVTLLKDRFGWAAVAGKNSVLGKLEAGGYKVLPKGDSPPDTKEDARFNGGHIVSTFGSHTGYGIDAIQLELGGELRAKAKYPTTAKDLAAAVAAFHAEYLTK